MPSTAPLPASSHPHIRQPWPWPPGGVSGVHLLDTARKSGVCSPASPAGEIKGQEGLPGQSCAASGRGEGWCGKSSSFPLQCVQTTISFLQRCAGTSPLETQTSTKALPSEGDCLRQPSFSRVSQAVAERDWGQFKGHFLQSGLESVPLTWWTGG